MSEIPIPAVDAFCALPNEIVIQIIQTVKDATTNEACYICYSCAYKILHSLCLVSKRLNRLTEPVLYRDFADPGGCPKHREAGSFRLIHFLETLTRGRVQLANHVRSCFFWYGQTVIQVDKDKTLFSGDCLTQLDKAMSGVNTSNDFRSKWREDLYSLERNALVAFALGLLPNLRDVALRHMGDGDDDSWMKMFLRGALDGQQPNTRSFWGTWSILRSYPNNGRGILQTRFLFLSWIHFDFSKRTGFETPPGSIMIAALRRWHCVFPRRRSPDRHYARF